MHSLRARTCCFARLYYEIKRMASSGAEGLFAPDKRLLKPISVPEGRLLTGPGPSNLYPRVVQAGTLPLLGHMHPETLEVMSEITAGLQYLFQTTNTLTLALSGTGHAGMEASLVNLLEDGDRVMVLRNGIWGERAADIAERCGGVVHTLHHPTDEVFTLQEIEEGLSSFKPVVLFACQGESSNGTQQPIQGLGELCHRYNCLLLVDAVASLGGVPFYMDKWGVDVAYSGSQKVLGAPPGTAPISFGPRARAKMAQRKSKVRSFYFDMDWLAKYWGVDGIQRVYHHTGPVISFYALREALAIMAEEGLEASWKRHGQVAEELWKGLEEMGLELYINDKAIRLPTVTTIKVPAGVNWKNVTGYIMKNCNVEISGGLGPTVGQVWRVGMMGCNASPASAQRIITVLRDTLKKQQTKL